MKTRQVFIGFYWLVALVIGMGCERNLPSVATSHNESPSSSSVVAVQDGWETHEDDSVRFSHPNVRKVVRVHKGAELGHFVMAPGNVDGMPGPETISILPTNDKRTESMSLREIALGHVGNAAKEQTKLVGNLQNRLLTGGHCVSYMLEGPNLGGCMTPDGNRPVCRLLSLRAECETDKKIRVEINSTAEVYPDAGKPSPRAREQVQVFERLVKSIEFKK